jgi:hypothetical protein
MGKLFIVDTGLEFDRPIKKGQWTVQSIEEGVEKMQEWLEEKAANLVGELGYAELDGSGPIQAFRIREDFDVKVALAIELIPKTKHPVQKTPVTEEDE